MGTGVSWPAGLSWRPMQVSVPTYTLKDIVPSLAGGLARCHMMHMLAAKKKEHSFRLKQGTVLPHKVISWEQAVWVVYFLVRKCPEPRPSLMQASGWWKTACLWILPSPTESLIEIHCFSFVNDCFCNSHWVFRISLFLMFRILW